LVSLGYEERCVAANRDGYRLSIPPPALEHDNILFVTQVHLSSCPALAAKWKESV
jgi:hypothetical protein